MKKPDLLVLIAVWQFILAFLVLIGVAAIAVFAFPAVSNNYWGYGGMMDGYYGDMGRTGGFFGLSIAIFFLVCLIAVAVMGGIGLLMGKEWGRITSIISSALVLVAFPIGTAIGILSIIYLVKPEVKEYFLHTKPPASGAP